VDHLRIGRWLAARSRPFQFEALVVVGFVASRDHVRSE